jgi:hypothetical protein
MPCNKERHFGQIVLVIDDTNALNALGDQPVAKRMGVRRARHHDRIGDVESQRIVTKQVGQQVNSREDRATGRRLRRGHRKYVDTSQKTPARRQDEGHGHARELVKKPAHGGVILMVVEDDEGRSEVREKRAEALQELPSRWRDSEANRHHLRQRLGVPRAGAKPMDAALVMRSQPVSEHIGKERLSASASADERDATERVTLDQCNERVQLTLTALQARARRVSSSLRRGMALSHRDRSAEALARRGPG